MLLLKQLNITRNFTRFSKVLCQQAKPQVEQPVKDENERKGPNVKYHKLQINDKSLAQLLTTVKSKKKLEKTHQIIVEGNMLIKEAVKSHYKLNYLLFSHLDKITEIVDIMGSSSSNVNFLKVPQQDLSFWSVLTTCPGLIGIFEKPQPPLPKENALPISIICDNIREPNNVGAVIRLASSLPATKVFLPKGCADPWETKAIRGSSGSVFHMATEDSLTWQEIEQKISKSEDTIVLIADNDASKYLPSRVVQYDQIPKELIEGKEIYLLLGGETHGIGDDAINFALNRNWNVLNIPIHPSVNSLNSSNALAIVLFELRRKLLQ